MEIRDFAVTISQVIINPILALLFAGALLVFIFGIVEFLWGLNQKAGSIEKGRQHMIWGVIGMFIMIAAYTIIRIIGNTVGNNLGSGI
jgi:hypothetical protein